MRNLYLIIRREYLERVNGKSFIITTLLMPVLMIGLMIAPALIMFMSGPENKQIALIDASGIIAPTIKSSDEIKYVSLPSDVNIDSIKAMESFDAVLVIDEKIVDFPDKATLYTRGAPSMTTEDFISRSIADAISHERSKKYHIENIRQIIDDLQPSVHLTTFRIDRESEEETSSFASYMVGLVCAFLLYMFIMIYGQMVMTSIIEEKNNRVLEVIVSSVKPNTLMLGKIVGIGAVAITQILIWAILVGSFSRWIMPLILSSMQGGDTELLTAMGQLGQTGYILMLFFWIIIFLAFGYLFYSTIYAAIGSAVDNIQDASQLTSLAVIPIVLGFMFTMAAINDPNSSLSFWASIIPFTSPMVMLARIPFGIPAWEIALSLTVLIISSLFMVWLCAKIYRVGIFMYGKKPSFKDLIRWARYK